MNGSFTNHEACKSQVPQSITDPVSGVPHSHNGFAIFVSGGSSLFANARTEARKAVRSEIISNSFITQINLKALYNLLVSSLNRRFDLRYCNEIPTANLWGRKLTLIKWTLLYSEGSLINRQCCKLLVLFEMATWKVQTLAKVD